jgi:DNA-binding NarL/FixJ family response regulator
MQKLKVLIVDDYNAVRQGLADFLADDPQIELIGTAISGVEAVAKTGELKPDIVLMDIVMPEMDGIVATQIIKQNHPNTKVIILTGVLDNISISKALAAGASGYLLKTIEQDELCDTIKNIGSNTTVPLPAQVAQELLKDTGSIEKARMLEHLSEREIETLRMVAQGKANKEIAHKLSLSEGTVKTYVSNIMAKLGVQSRTQMALYAHKEALNLN